jgi:hypothetical protein
MAEVAFLLGYQNPSAFQRAFRRWSGRSPRPYRHAAGQEAVVRNPKFVARDPSAPSVGTLKYYSLVTVFAVSEVGKDSTARIRTPPSPAREELNRVVRGWANYFTYGTRLMGYRAVDSYVYERLRHFLRRRHKVPTRGTERFPAGVVLGEWGVFQLRCFHLETPAPARV